MVYVVEIFDISVFRDLNLMHLYHRHHLIEPDIDNPINEDRGWVGQDISPIDTKKMKKKQKSRYLLKNEVPIDNEVHKVVVLVYVQNDSSTE